MERFDLVQKAYGELVQEGKIFPVEEPKQEEQKALITRRAAYYLNQIDSNLGLLSKTSGNQVQGLSVDIIVHKNGDYWDIATDRDAGGGKFLASIVDGSTKHDDSLSARWVQPKVEWAGFDVHSDAPHSDIPHEDTSQDTSNDQDVIIALLVEAMRKMVQEELAKVKFPEYAGTIELGRFLGTAHVTLKPKE